jgi:NAD(P)-dependent dehydrogenase (short-subunit alcohol dehydrogenase family)
MRPEPAQSHDSIRAASPRPIAVVVGAGRGIGAACATLFAKQGYDLVIASRTKAELEATATSAGASGVSVLAVNADVCNDASVDALAQAIARMGGRVDVLVNCAGEACLGTIDDTDADAFDAMVQSNLVGPYRVIRALLPFVRQSRGHIINVLSRAGRRPYDNAVAYGSAKAAMDYVTRALAAGLGPAGIRVNGISPGAVATALRKRVFPSEDPSTLMTPAAVAAAIVQMTTPAFAAMNGAVIDFPM